MRHSLHIWLAVITCALPIPLHAQNANNIWYFGNRAGITFNGGGPTALTDGELTTGEGSAVLCDPSTGALLFYTDGVTVWNAKHEPMTNGTGLAGHSSSTQSALILPDPGDPLQYYIFTVDAGPETGETFYDGLKYSRVDMRASGGLGAITDKNIPLFPDSASEKLTATKHCNGRDYWVVTHEWGTDRFYAFLLGPTGISGPVISRGGSVYSRNDNDLDYSWRSAIGYMKFSLDGRRLVSVNSFVLNAAGSEALKANVELFSFDNSTGRISNAAEIFSLLGGKYLYGLAFSPDNSKLYVSAWDYSTTFWQLDLSAGNADAIRASVQEIRFPGGDIGALQLGPDGKIYANHRGSTMLDVFSRPNNLAPDCGYISNAVSLDGRMSNAGLPNMNESDFALALSSTTDTICQGDSVLLTAPDGVDFMWSPSTGIRCLRCRETNASPGQTTTYTVTITHANGGCSRVLRTVVVDATSLDVPEQIRLCKGDSVQLSASGALSYEWSPAAGLSCTTCPSPWAAPQETTTYTVRGLSSRGCFSTRTVTVIIPQVDAGVDRTICAGDSVQLFARDSGAVVEWSPAEGLSCIDCPGPVARPRQTTTYTVTSTSINGCRSTDQVTIQLVDKPVRAHIPHDLVGHSDRSLTVPVILDDPLDDADVGSLRFTIRYDPTMLRLRSSNRRLLETMTHGTLLEGWKIEVLTDSGGVFSAMLTAPSSRRNLRGTGELLRLQYIVFALVTDSARRISELPFEISIPGLSCYAIAADAGRADVTVCGLAYRLIERMTGKYLLERNHPNPFNPTTEITFSIGLDGPTRLEVFDASGRRVGLLVDAYLEPGSYSVTWDASAHPSGLYYYRLTSSEWSRTAQMLLVK